MNMGNCAEQKEKCARIAPMKKGLLAIREEIELGALAAKDYRKWRVNGKWLGLRRAGGK